MSEILNRDGEYIDLAWEFGSPCRAYYVRGHIDEATALKVIEDQDEMCDGKLKNGADIGKARHLYAKWSLNGDSPPPFQIVLKEYKEPGKGRFKVTAFHVVKKK